MGHLLYLMFWCDFDVMENLESLEEVGVTKHSPRDEASQPISHPRTQPTPGTRQPRTSDSSVGSLARCASGRAWVRFLWIATHVPHRVLRWCACVLVCVRVWGGVCKSRYDAFWDFSDSLVCAESGQRRRPKFLMTSQCSLVLSKKKRCWPRLESACKSTLQKVVTGWNIRFYPFLDLPNELIKWII